MVYVMYVNEFRRDGEAFVVAAERAGDTFLSQEELVRKQNAAALKAMGITGGPKR